MPYFWLNQWNDFDAVVTFIVPILINLVAMKYEGMPDSPFDTHPITVFLTVFTLLLYCILSFPHVADQLIFRTPRGARIFLWLRVFSCLSVAFLTLLLFRGLLFFLLYFPLLVMLFPARSWDLIQKLKQKMLEVVARVRRLFGRREEAILPRTVFDVTSLTRSNGPSVCA
ncbi:hypothetical protein ACJRO7_027734 [Eucalyptus globulus]|uniref:Uncharacterized protein n=1 Tax=Eucalyptus globulus TaxID=34317 RepID=A0ABD3K2B6_EUCGL